MEVHPGKNSAEAKAVLPATEASVAKSATGAESVDPAEAFKETLREAAATVSVAGGGPVRRVHGSQTLFEPSR